MEKETNEKIKVAVMGLPGKKAWTMAETIARSEHFELVPVSLTDSKTLVDSVTIGGVPIRLFTKTHRKSMFVGVNPDAIIHCLAPAANKRNMSFYENEFMKTFCRTFCSPENACWKK